jgi:hypothetical protein
MHRNESLRPWRRPAYAAVVLAVSAIATRGADETPDLPGNPSVEEGERAPHDDLRRREAPATTVRLYDAAVRDFESQLLLSREEHQ